MHERRRWKPRFVQSYTTRTTLLKINTKRVTRHQLQLLNDDTNGNGQNIVHKDLQNIVHKDLSIEKFVPFSCPQAQPRPWVIVIRRRRAEFFVSDFVLRESRIYRTRS